MRQPTYLSLLIIAAACAALSGCAKPKPTVPMFVTFDSQRLGAINAGSESAGNSFANIKERLEAISETPLAGTDVQISDSVINNGAPARGIKVIVRGTAFDNGIFGPPKSAMVAAPTADGKGKDPVEFALSADPAGGYSGTYEARCEKDINVGLIVPAKKGGEGEVQIFVSPLDKGASSSAAFTHSYSVRSETDDSQNSSE